MNRILHLRARMACARPIRLSALVGALLLAAYSGSMATDGPISAMQEALRREALYTGEPTGVLDGPTRSALRRYQILHSLPVSGEIDSPTLQALEKSAAPTAIPAPAEVPTATPAPAPPPEIVEGDRQFLKQVESTGTPPPAVPDSAPPPVVEPPADLPIEVAPSPAPPAKISSAKPKPAPARKRPVDQPREETVRVERALPDDSGGSAELGPHRPVAQFAPGSVASGERESDLDATAPAGVKVTRTTTTTTVRDARTRSEEKKIEEAPIPEVVRFPPAPRVKRPNFFSRLFHGSAE